MSGLSELYCSKRLSQSFEHFLKCQTARYHINFPDNKSIDARENIFNLNVAIFGDAYSSETLEFHAQNRADWNECFSYNVHSTRENSSCISLLLILFPFPHVYVQSSSSVAFDTTTKRINRRLSCDCIHCILTVSAFCTLDSKSRALVGFPLSAPCCVHKWKYFSFAFVAKIKMIFAHNRGFSCIARAMRLHRTGSACKLHNVRKKKSHFITIHLSFIPFLPVPIHSLGRIVGTAKAFSLIYVLLFGLFKFFILCSCCAVALRHRSFLLHPHAVGIFYSFSFRCFVSLHLDRCAQRERERQNKNKARDVAIGRMHEWLNEAPQKKSNTACLRSCSA